MLRLGTFLALSAMLWGMALPVTPSGAARGLPASCDSEFMSVMEARATMEGEREIEMAETLILKPDSVLAYSCFSGEIQTLNTAAQTMLSANTGPRLFGVAFPFLPNDFFQPGWGIMPGILYTHPLSLHPTTPFHPGAPIFGTSHPLDSNIGPMPNLNYNEGIWLYSYPPDPKDNSFKYPGAGHFDNSLQIMILDALIRHFENNFNHTYLGGTGGAAANCATMQKIWDSARCDNFDRVHFYKFSELSNFDPRQKPEACSGPKSMSWSSMINKANTAPGTPGGMQPIKTFLTFMNRNALDPNDKNACEKSLVVDTGVEITSGMKTGSEKICSMPACSYIDNKCQ